MSLLKCIVLLMAFVAAAVATSKKALLGLDEVGRAESGWGLAELKEVEDILRPL